MYQYKNNHFSHHFLLARLNFAINREFLDLTLNLASIYLFVSKEWVLLTLEA